MPMTELSSPELTIQEPPQTVFDYNPWQQLSIPWLDQYPGIPPLAGALIGLPQLIDHAPKLTRRNFFKWSAVATAGTALTACTPTPVPTPESLYSPDNTLNRQFFLDIINTFPFPPNYDNLIPGLDPNGEIVNSNQLEAFRLLWLSNVIDPQLAKIDLGSDYANLTPDQQVDRQNEVVTTFLKTLVDKMADSNFPPLKQAGAGLTIEIINHKISLKGAKIPDREGHVIKGQISPGMFPNGITYDLDRDTLEPFFNIEVDTNLLISADGQINHLPPTEIAVILLHEYRHLWTIRTLFNAWRTQFNNLHPNQTPSYPQVKGCLDMILGNLSLELEAVAHKETMDTLFAFKKYSMDNRLNPENQYPDLVAPYLKLRQKNPPPIAPWADSDWVAAITNYLKPIPQP
jgi:hypothetical protein